MMTRSSATAAEINGAAAESIHQLPPTWDEPSSSVSGCEIKRPQGLSRQLSLQETRMEAKWEMRQWQILQRQSAAEEGGEGGGGGGGEEAGAAAESTSNSGNKRRSVEYGRTPSLTDEDLEELRGSIDLGFGFDEEEGGQNLCDTLPALNLYFAVNRQFSDPKLQTTSPSPASTPRGAAIATSSWATLAGLPSPRSPIDQHSSSAPPSSEAWKICNPGDSPQHVKTRLRHWAQVVACSLKQKLASVNFHTMKEERHIREK